MYRTNDRDRDGLTDGLQRLEPDAYALPTTEEDRSHARRRYAANPRRKLDSNRRWAIQNPCAVLLRHARRRARDRGLEFTLTRTELESLWPANGRCPIRKTMLIVGGGANSPSLDRIDNNRGYTRDNCAIISDRANRLKNDGTAKEHAAIAAWMRTQLGRTTDIET